MTSIRLLICLCFVTLAFGLTNENELRKTIESCCKRECSTNSLDSLHDRLSVYRKSHDANAELIDFGMKVLGGKRCGQVHAARDVAKSTPSHPKSRSTRASTYFTLNCPRYVQYYSGRIDCNASIHDDTVISSIGVYTEPYDYLTCASTCYFSVSGNTTSFDFPVSFYFTAGVASNVRIVAYYYAGNNWNITYSSKNVTILGLPVTTSTSGRYSTTGSYSTGTISSTSYFPGTSGSGSNNYVSFFNCPSTVYTNGLYSNFTCEIGYYAYPSAISFSSYSSSLNCLNCYQDFNNGISYYQYTATFSTAGYTSGTFSITIFFYTTYNEYVSNTFYVTLAYQNPQITLDRFVGPSLLPSSFNSFNVELDITSDYGVSYVYIYYVSENYNYAAYGNGYYYYYNTTNSLTVTLNQYNNYIIPGKYCALVSVTDNQNNYATFNGTCFRIANSGCQAGYYGSLVNGTSEVKCLACPQGFYSENAGSYSCSPCPSGYTSSCASASRSCVACPAGTSSKGGLCVPCPSGTYNTYQGQSTCFPCAAGNYANGTGNTYCNNCNYGTYSCAGASNCTVCKAGTYASYSASSCLTCLDGHSSDAGSYYCYQCPANTYAVSGSPKCTNCPSGKTSPAGSFACYTAKK